MLCHKIFSICLKSWFPEINSSWSLWNYGSYWILLLKWWTNFRVCQWLLFFCAPLLVTGETLRFVLVWQNFVPYENIQESGGTRYLPLLHSLHRAKLSGLFLHYLIINIGNFWILVESLYYQDYGWSAIWDGRKKLPHVGVSQKEGDSEFCPSTSCRLCPKVPWCQSSPQEHPGKCFQEAGGFLWLEYRLSYFKIQVAKGTINNVNSSSSPGITHSGRPRTQRTDQNKQAVKAVLDRDAQKRIGDAMVSPVNSARLNTLGLNKSTWCRLVKDLRYHPYKPLRRHELQPADLPRRLHFCRWLVQLPDAEILKILSSDEATFQLHGQVNSQNIRRYAPLKTSDPVNGGKPDHFVDEGPTFSPKLMVFCGLRRDGTFGLKFYRNQALTGATYHSLLQYTVFPELRIWNNGNLDQLYWQQDGATVHCTDRNMRYLDNLFGERVISRRALRGREWPPRSPDLSPLDFFLWGYLKSKVHSSWSSEVFQLNMIYPGVHTQAKEFGRVGGQYPEGGSWSWPRHGEQVPTGHEGEGPKVHHCWWSKLWVKISNKCWKKIWCDEVFCIPWNTPCLYFGQQRFHFPGGLKQA